MMNLNTSNASAKVTNGTIGKIILLLIVITFAGFANASLLASTTVDKQVLAENEVAFLTVKIMNDSAITEQNVYLRIQADSGIVFIQGIDEVPNFVQTIDSIKQNEVKEIKLKIKSTSITAKNANVYAYFGKEVNLKQAAVTTIQLEKSTVDAKATILSNQNSTAVIEFIMKNKLKTPITNASAELVAAKGFDVQTPPIVEEKILPEGELTQKFKVMTPISANGEQKMIIAYGYFDANTPHYFEKTITLNLFRPNYTLIGLVGFIILIIAAYFFLKKDNKKEESKKDKIKGTGEKQ